MTVGDAMVQVATKAGSFVRHALISAYVMSGNETQVDAVRVIADRVTVVGRSGLETLSRLAREGSLDGVDLDPGTYALPAEAPSLFPFDWVARQRELGLAVVRSPGIEVRSNDPGDLRAAFAGKLADDVRRVVSLNAVWLKPANIDQVVRVVKACDDALTLVLADQFDPLGDEGAIDSLLHLVDVAGDGGRPLELIRSDIAALGVVATGAAAGSIGVTTSSRHHGLPFSAKARQAMTRRQTSPLLLVPRLCSWHRGVRVGALAPFGGAGLTDCPCKPCAGRDLLRFDVTFPGRTPRDIAYNAMLHDLASWVAITRSVLDSPDPAQSWREICTAAQRKADEVADLHKVLLDLPRSVSYWAS